MKVFGKKCFAVLLALTMLAAMVPAWTVGAETEYTSIRFDDLTVFEKLDEYEMGFSPISWMEYAYMPRGEITTADGDTVPFLDGLDTDGDGMEDEWVVCEDGQSLLNPWKPGNTYTVTGTLMGLTGTFHVTVAEYPIASISVPPVSIIEGTRQLMSWDWETERDYFRYDYGSLLSAVVTMKDGTQQTIDCWETISIGERDFSLYAEDDQSPDNVWGVGTHTATVLLAGTKTTTTVEITASPAASLTVEDCVARDGIDGWEDIAWDEEGEEYSFFHYRYDPAFTVTLKDGTVLRSEAGGYEMQHVVIDGEYYYLQTLDTQSDEVWTYGEHTVTASLLGCSCDFTVTAVENPVASLTVEDCTVRGNVDGWEATIWEEDGKRSFFYYDYSPAFAVELKDGTVLHSQKDEFDNLYIVLDGVAFYPEMSDTQWEEPWDVGEHTATALLFGYTADFTVTVTESPIERVEFRDIEIIESFDGYTVEMPDEAWQFIYEYAPSYTVYCKDGTVLQSDKDGCVKYDGKWYFVNLTDTQWEEPWGLGEHTATASIFGFAADFTVTVTENPYTSLSISGTDELVITLTKKSGESVKMVVTNFADGAGDVGTVIGSLTTDQRYFPHMRFCYDPASDYDRGLTLTIGTLTSNTLDGNTWFQKWMMPYMIGDLTDDGGVDSDDLTALARIVARIDEPTALQQLAGDVTGDGNVDSDDLTRLAQYVARIIDEL